MKKYLNIRNLVFNLPDDFKGNLTEALEELVKYRKSEEAKKQRVILDEQISNLDDSYKILKDREETRLSLSFGFSIEHEGKRYDISGLEDLID